MLLLKVNTIRNQILFKEGDVSDRVFIVSKGEYELERNLPRDLKEGARKLVGLLGGDDMPKNVFS